jgi:hypothetical protein
MAAPERAGMGQAGATSAVAASQGRSLSDVSMADTQLGAISDLANRSLAQPLHQPDEIPVGVLDEAFALAYFQRLSPIPGVLAFWSSLAGPLQIQRQGLQARPNIDMCSPPSHWRLQVPSLNGGCVWGPYGQPGLARCSPDLQTCT